MVVIEPPPGSGIDNPIDGVVVIPPDDGVPPSPDVDGDKQNFLDPDTNTERPTESPVAPPEPLLFGDLVVGNIPAVGQESGSGQAPTPARLGYVFGNVRRPSVNTLD